MRRHFRRFARHESGATAMEYGLVAALVGLAVMLGIKALAPAIDRTFARLVGEIGSGFVVVDEHSRLPREPAAHHATP